MDVYQSLYCFMQGPERYSHKQIVQKGHLRELHSPLYQCFSMPGSLFLLDTVFLQLMTYIPPSADLHCPTRLIPILGVFITRKHDTTDRAMKRVFSCANQIKILFLLFHTSLHILIQQLQQS